jgi:predicted nuclease of predicted toxin-antitoxin system
VLLLLDENTSERRLVERLRTAGHDIETSVARLGVGAADSAIVSAALASRRAVVTRDCADFRTLYAALAQHPGLLLIYGGKATTTTAVVNAVNRIADLYVAPENLILSLNDFFW